jgi:hypothetical protein
MAAFVTLCEAYMGIEPHINQWNYFFRAWLQQGLDTETMALAIWTSLFDPGLKLIPTFPS